ncbi:MAG: SHOCT domain-containing protein [Nitrospiria bacterium]
MILYLILYRCILIFLFLSAILAFFWAIQGYRKDIRKQNIRKKGSIDHDMLRFLQALYAEGEIDKEEYEARKKNLAA